MAKGGKRPGAGRPIGSKTINIRDYFTEDDVKTFFEFVLSTYMENPKLTMWVGDHLLGKAPQAMDLTTGGKELPTPILNVLGNNSHKEGSETKQEN